MQNTNKYIPFGTDFKEVDTDRSGRMDITVAEAGSYEAVFLQKNARLDINVHLTGKGAKCRINVVYLSSGAAENTINCHVYHESPETYSNQDVRGVLAMNGRTVYNGLIRIEKDSQKCEGHQNHRAVLLSKEGSASCTPELEIFADDVQCTHGSAIGALDENEMFYIQSRGIDASEAKKMLIKGFLSDILDGNFEKELNEWMAQNA